MRVLHMPTLDLVDTSHKAVKKQMKTITRFEEILMAAIGVCLMATAFLIGMLWAASR